jgi:hypothetical protein
MASLGQSVSPGLVKGFLQSYGGDLRGWLTGLAIRYAVAIVLLLAAGAGLVAAIGVGINALFHWIEARYGLTIAYEAVAGALVVLAMASALTGIVLLKGAPPRLPRPHRHGRSMAAKAVPVLAAQNYKALVKADRTTEMMIGLAAACLVGWLITSRTQARTK